MAPIVGSRPFAAGAALLLGLESLLAALGVHAAWLSLAALVLVPGLALAPLLPARVRTSPVAVLAAAPALGSAASSVLLVSLSSAGASLNGTVVRLSLAGLVVAGLLLPWPEAGRRLSRADLPVAGGLALALAAGALLQQ